MRWGGGVSETSEHTLKFLYDKKKSGEHTNSHL